MDLKSWFAYFVIGVLGLSLTYFYMTPGQYEIPLGVLRFDPYYVSMTGFVSLVILAILDVVGISIPESFYHPRFRN